jgi:hypothetical protein
MNLWSSPAALAAAVERHGQAAVDALPRFTRGRFKGLPKGVLTRAGDLLVFGAGGEELAEGSTQAPIRAEPPPPAAPATAQAWLPRLGGYEAIDEDGRTSGDRRRDRLIEEGRLSADPQNIREKDAK